MREDTDERLDALEQALGNTAGCTNIIKTGVRRKLVHARLDEIEDGPVKDAIHVLASLLFDLLARMEWLFEGTEAYLPGMDPDLMLRREQMEEEFGVREAEEAQDYAELAIRLENVVLALTERNLARYREVADELRPRGQR